MSLTERLREWRYRRACEADTAVLHALSDGRPHYVHADLHSTTQLRYGRLYPALTRLVARGLVEDEWDAEPSARRSYRLTDAGRAELSPRPTRTERTNR